jgi:tRNA 2-thiouridine synthesizing protein A
MGEKKNGIAVAKTLDCKGDLCPMPIYKTSRAMTQLKDGEILEVVCTDRGAIKDFPAFCGQTGHELVHSDVTDGLQTFYIRKASA